MSEKIPFRPVVGTEEQISNSTLFEGMVAFATDTKKIYYNDGENNIPMGGNSGIYYANKIWEETPGEGQIEFYFVAEDIEESQIPNVNDLILNIPDGSFYRVVEIQNYENPIKIKTNRLTLSGGGGGGNAFGQVTLNKIGKGASGRLTTLYQSKCELGIKINAYDADKQPISGSGTYKVMVGGLVKMTGSATTNSELYFDVGPYLYVEKNVPVKIELTINTDLGYTTVLTATWQIDVTEVKLTWNYSDTQINRLEDALELDYSVSGTGLEKTLHFIVNGIDLAEDILDPFKGTTAEKDFIIENLKAYGLSHGAYKAEMYVTTNIEGEPFRGQSIVHNLIFVEDNNDNTIISCNFYKNEITQYDTVEIPIITYSRKNSLGDLTLDLIEDGVKIGDIKNVANATVYNWAYTPTQGGLKTLVIQSGTAQTSITVQVLPIDIDIDEVSGAVYNFKASNFANSDGIKDWSDSKGNKLISFSNNFDWINGGLKQEVLEDGSIRPYLCIKAGSYINMNYELFGNVRKGSGKTIKIIFKATNCRDYDAQVLSCKKDIKTIKTNTDEEFLLVLDDGVNLEYAEAILINEDGSCSLYNPQSAIFNRQDEASRAIFEKKFIKYEDNFYKCYFEKIEEEENKYYSYFYKAKPVDSFRGLYMTAQQSFYRTINEEMEAQYCEDSYIEFELDIGKQDSSSAKKNYLKFWMDGVPANFVVYSNSDSFSLDAENGKTPYITIGSNECDVYLYLLKIYDKGLTDDQHLQNFIADGYNSNEIVARFKRNDILDERNIISPTKLAVANPDCAVHVYTIDRISQRKKDPVPGCSYRQYKGSNEAFLTAEDVTIKVQGTSSEKYVISAANLDSSFDSGFTLNGQHIDHWSMTDDAIGINFFCTKVNVASCENANNALNQMWYNAFQPYKTVLRCKNPKARDTMQFINGVLFIQDNNTTADDSAAVKNNIFCEIDGYAKLPNSQKYPMLYSLANMGNSKDNIEVFHDTTNPKECCVEVNDNQMPQQQMISDDFLASDIDDGKKYFGFRYPDKAKNATPEMIQGWMDFVSWMAKSNPQPMYEIHTATNEKEFKSFSYNQKKAKNVDVFYAEYDNNEICPRPIRYIQINEFNPNITEYFTKTDNKYGYTNLPLDLENTELKRNYGDYEFVGYKAEEQKRENGELWQKDYQPLIAGTKVTQYNYQKYLTYDEETNQIIPNGIADESGYTHDTYEYRMAKMLHECEEHLVMDSVIYHYLFIERHCMIDNVAKNTFWSTEDGKVWNLTKDYDNDTADGNDNNGKFTRTYGMEPMDKLNSNTYVFNARQSVWLNFIDGLDEAKNDMYQKLEAIEVDINGTKMKLWNKDHYLKVFKDWQNMIPERAWIEAYRRLYIRPYEVYGDGMYIPMMEGGKKAHQRTQFETYQDIYMSSKYIGTTSESQNIIIRGNGTGILGNKLLVKTYCDCYVVGQVGGVYASQRTKRNEESWVECPMDDINNVTYYIKPAQAITVLGDPEGRDGFGSIGDYLPEQISFSNAIKLKEVNLGLYQKGTNNKSFDTGLSFNGTPLLEKINACNFTNYTGSLSLENCLSLKELDARNSSFTEVSLANGCPVSKIKLQNPSSLVMRNLSNIQEFDIDEYNRLVKLDLENIDNSPGINSKDILTSVKNTPKFERIQYRLLNVDWTLDDEEEVDETNNTIPLVEYLLENNTYETADGRLDKKQAFTGNIYVTSEAYDGNESIDIYNEYVNSDEYSNLDISFEDDNSKLYKIYVYDGNGKIYWQKRIQTNGTINNTSFFADGPNGKLDISKMLKSETATTVYEFLNKWDIKINDVSVGQASWNEDGYINYEDEVVNDIHLYPVYQEIEKQYTLNFYDETGKNLLLSVNNAKYGDLLSKHFPTTIPYKADSDLPLYETYSFKGYSLFVNSDIVLPPAYTITNWEQEQNFYAVFQRANVYEDSNIHEDYFEITSNGVIKPAKTLSGKITIPGSIRNIKVTEIDGNAFRNNKGITHIFLQPNNSIRALGKAQGADSDGSSGNYGCFALCSNLQYFDFNNFNGEILGNGTFFSCNLTNESPLNLTNKAITTIGSNCFNSGFKDGSLRYEINLPNTLTLLENFAIANNNIGDFTITIGTPSAPLNKDILTSNVAIRDNSGKLLHIYYYCAAVPDSLTDEEKLAYANYFGYKHNNSNALCTLVINGIDVVQNKTLQTAEGD